jgi:DNA-binding NarL/FixJ family response regulator
MGTQGNSGLTFLAVGRHARESFVVEVFHSGGLRSMYSRVPKTNVYLSPRERQVISRVAHGLSNREIGDELGIVESTVKFHLNLIGRKISVRRRVLIARWYWENYERE